MTAYDRLSGATATSRAEFLAIPLIGRALTGDVSRSIYLAFLQQAYHHVRHTCPLLSLAAAKTSDDFYRAALYRYLREEEGHDEWILADIAALGGDAGHALRSTPRPPCRAMVGYAYYAIDWISPYALLGMVHVLEGMSATLASRAAQALKTSIGSGQDAGFRYLTSHGELDIGHTAFFRDLLNRLPTPSAVDLVIDCTRTMYGLYGNIFRDLESNMRGGVDAAP